MALLGAALCVYHVPVTGPAVEAACLCAYAAIVARGAVDMAAALRGPAGVAASADAPRGSVEGHLLRAVPALYCASAIVSPRVLPGGGLLAASALSMPALAEREAPASRDAPADPFSDARSEASSTRMWYLYAGAVAVGFAAAAATASSPGASAALSCACGAACGLLGPGRGHPSRFSMFASGVRHELTARQRAIIAAGWTVYVGAVAAHALGVMPDECAATAARLCELSIVLTAWLAVDVAGAERAIDTLSNNSVVLSDILPPHAIRSLASRDMTSRFVMHPECVIMFADIVDFTRMSSERPAADVVVMLSKLFGLFDAIVVARGLSKVETIGDAYMTVCEGTGACNMVMAARDMIRAASKVSVQPRSTRIVSSGEGNLIISWDADDPMSPTRGDTVRLRIGVHVGDVYAGVVSKLRPRYCFIGDAINTASRMQSGGAAMRIHVSDDFKRLVERLAGGQRGEGAAGGPRVRYSFEDAGLKHHKGKGDLRSWFVEVAGGSIDIVGLEKKLKAGGAPPFPPQPF